LASDHLPVLTHRLPFRTVLRRMRCFLWTVADPRGSEAEDRACCLTNQAMAYRMLGKRRAAIATAHKILADLVTAGSVRYPRVLALYSRLMRELNSGR